MFRRVLLSSICVAVCLSLSNSVLLLGQFAAWSKMTEDRLDERGVASALLSSLEGEELCEVCLVVREGSRKQSESGALKESSGIAKLLNLPDDEDALFVSRPDGRRACIRLTDIEIPVGLSGEVAKPPPRLEV